MNRRRLVNVTLSLAGVVLLVWLVRETGIDKVRTGLTSVGWGFLAILALSFTRFFLRSYAWATLLDAPVPLRAAVAATISGDALGNVTPLGLMASEPAKSVYLAAHIPPAQSFAALTAENFFYSVSVAMYISLGGIALLGAFAVDDNMRLVGVGSLLAMGIVLGGAGWIAWRKPAAASALLARVPSVRVAQLLQRVERFESRTYGSARITGSRLVRLVTTEGAFHIVSFVECWYTLWLLTGASSPLAALVLDSVNRVINIVFRMIPFRMGADEFFAKLMGAAVNVRPDLAVVMALVRKARLIVWAAVGFGIWLAASRSSRAPSAAPRPT